MNEGKCGVMGDAYNSRAMAYLSKSTLNNDKKKNQNENFEKLGDEQYHELNLNNNDNRYDNPDSKFFR